MFKLSKLTDYALVILSYLDNKKVAMDAKELALHTTINYPTVAKICKNLAKNGLLLSKRGAKGGYQLDPKCYEISFLEIIEAIEGPLTITECGFKDFNCMLASKCCVMTPLKKINTLILDALKSHTLESFIRLGDDSVA
jgi:FeS assembly SUF system regulator